MPSTKCRSAWARRTCATRTILKCWRSAHGSPSHETSCIRPSSPGRSGTKIRSPTSASNAANLSRSSIRRARRAIRNIRASTKRCSPTARRRARCSTTSTTSTRRRYASLRLAWTVRFSRESSRTRSDSTSVRSPRHGRRCGSVPNARGVASGCSRTRALRVRRRR